MCFSPTGLQPNRLNAFDPAGRATCTRSGEECSLKRSGSDDISLSAIFLPYLLSQITSPPPWNLAPMFRKPESGDFQKPVDLVDLQ